MVTAKIYPGTPRGEVKIPASKSLAHRAVICAALAEGVSHIGNLTLSNDIQATIDGMAALGAGFNKLTEDSFAIKGAGFPLAGGPLTVDCGESGSTLRFFIPIFSLTGQRVRFICHGRLAERPQTVYQQLFAERGLRFAPFTDGSAAGWELCGSLTPGEYTLKGDISSQFISGLLFALPLLRGDSRLHILPPFESRSYVRLTLQTMEEFGITAEWRDDHTLFIPGGQHYRAADTQIEGDFSQMAFFAALGAINSPVTVTGMNPASAQGDKKIVELIRQMHGDIQPIKDGYTISPGKLTAAEIDLADCPDLGPILSVQAACAEGETRLYNARRLRIKESDRIADVEAELARFGIKTRSTADELFISGAAGQPQTEEACLSHNDHRIVMALSILATVCQKPVQILQAEAVGKSYPRFFADLQNLGIKVELIDAD